jgi:hypothetical protein
MVQAGNMQYQDLRLIVKKKKRRMAIMALPPSSPAQFPTTSSDINQFSTSLATDGLPRFDIMLRIASPNPN